MGFTKANAPHAKVPIVVDAPLPLHCLALEEDEVTPCSNVPTKDGPNSDRCDMHHGQYAVLVMKYTIASKVVDYINHRAGLPTKAHISQYVDWKSALDEARRVRRYLEAVRVEKVGRDLHRRRFFLQIVDDAHESRLELLEREMIGARDALGALHAKAYELYHLDGALLDMDGPTKDERDSANCSKRTAEEVLRSLRSPHILHESILPVPQNKLPSSVVRTEDLIDAEIRDKKEQLMAVLKPLTYLESFVDAFMEGGLQPEREFGKPMLEKLFTIYQQVARRIIFHQPALFMMSLGEVSLSDFILSNDFTIDELSGFLDCFLRPMEYPLIWLKDAILDILDESRCDSGIRIADASTFLGGWIFNRARSVSMGNEAWWFLLTILRPSANVEDRFVPLCNNFEDLVDFFSFAAFGLVPGPTFCKSTSQFSFDPDDPCLSRNHLSLSGVIVADIVSAPRHQYLSGPMPTTRAATKPGCIVWHEQETRTYMFGAMRDMPDAFVDGFLSELYARPDLFQVVLCSGTSHERDIEMFGLRSGPNTNDAALPAMRARYFEAPPELSPLSAPPSMRGEWEVEWSAVDVLFGKDKERQGYLADREKGSLLGSTTFPLTYFVILDAVPFRDRSVLARHVSWAALRAQGYAEGKYTVAKYARAADMLVERCARERLDPIPSYKDAGWEVTKMQDQMQSCCIM